MCISIYDVEVPYPGLGRRIRVSGLSGVIFMTAAMITTTVTHVMRNNEDSRNKDGDDPRVSYTWTVV